MGLPPTTSAVLSVRLRDYTSKWGSQLEDRVSTIRSLPSSSHCEKGAAVRKTPRSRWPSLRLAPISSSSISIGHPRFIKALQLPRGGIDAHVARGGQDLF